MTHYCADTVRPIKCPIVVVVSMGDWFQKTRCDKGGTSMASDVELFVGKGTRYANIDQTE